MNKPITDWRDKRIWLIGASTGIGASLAQLLAQRGARVAISARNPDKLDALIQRIGAQQPSHQPLTLPLDIGDTQQLEQARDRLLTFWQEIDVICLLAGAYQPVRAWQLNAGKIQQMIGTNVIGTMQATAAVVPQFLQQHHGILAIVASVAGYRGLPQALLYGASKAALINFTETLHMDLADQNISVYLINPGFVETPLTANNEFKMPALIKPEQAARAIIKGLEGSQFEIHFPKRFTYCLKLMRVLPYRWYFPLMRRMTGL